MPDERDLGNRPIVDALVPLMDELDKKERDLAAAMAPKRRAAEDALQAKAPGLAAQLFREVADAYRTTFGAFHHRTVEYDKRAADCVSLVSLSKRRKR